MACIQRHLEVVGRGSCIVEAKGVVVHLDFRRIAIVVLYVGEIASGVVDPHPVLAVCRLKQVECRIRGQEWVRNLPRVDRWITGS